MTVAAKTYPVIVRKLLKTKPVPENHPFHLTEMAIRGAVLAYLAEMADAECNACTNRGYPEVILVHIPWGAKPEDTIWANGFCASCASKMSVDEMAHTVGGTFVKEGNA